MRNIIWNNVDVVTPNDIYTNVRFELLSGVGKIRGRKNVLLEEAPIQNFEKAQGRWWKGTTENGVWEVNHLKCRCPDRSR